MLTVAYVGNFGPPTSTENQVAATLETMGHRVLRLQENAVGWDVIDYVASSCHMLLWTKTWSCPTPDEALRTLGHLERLGVPTVSFHLDLFFGLARAAQVADEPFFRTAWVFTADGGHDDLWAEAGVRHVWSPPAIHEPDCILGTPNDAYRADLAFVGSFPYPHPEHAAARAQLVRFCQQRYRGRFRLWRGGVRGRDLADLYATATIIIGDSCLAGRVPRYMSDRVFETVGRGGFLIHPHVDGMDELLEDGVHLRTYQHGDFHQLGTLIDHYLDRPDDRTAIAVAGHQHVKQHHTYRNRLERLVAIVAGQTAEPAAAVG